MDRETIEAIKGLETVQHLNEKLRNSGRAHPGKSTSYVHFIREELLEKILNHPDPSQSDTNIDGVASLIDDAHCAHQTLSNGLAAIGYLLTKVDGIEEPGEEGGLDTLGNLGWLIQDICGLIGAFERITYDLTMDATHPKKGGVQ